jgi:hypothetical protein
MLAPFECRIVLTDGRLTWTETYYRLNSSGSNAMASLRLLAQARQVILGGQASIASLRVARISPRGDVVRDGVSPGPVRPPGAHPSIAVLCRLAAGPTTAQHLYSTPLYLRGCPQDYFLRGSGQTQPGLAPPSSAVLGYLQRVTDLGFCLQVASKDLPRYPITGVAWRALTDADCAGNALNPDTLPRDQGVIVLGGSFAGLLADAAATGLPSPKIRVKGFRWSPSDHPALRQVDGIHDPLGVDQGAVSLLGKLPPVGQPSKLGFVRIAEFTYPAIVGGGIEGATKRDVGGRSKLRVPLQPGQIGAVVLVPAAPPAVQLATKFLPVVVPPVVPAGVITTLQDLAVEVWKGYQPDAQGISYPIGLYPMLSLGPGVLVVLSGTSDTTWNAIGIPEDIYAGLGLPDLYRVRILTVLTGAVPPPANLFLAGHSLGGMELSNALPALTKAGYTVYGYVTFGAPVDPDQSFRGLKQRILLSGDPAPFFTPTSIAATSFGVDSAFWYRLIADASAPANPIAIHNYYPQSPAVGLYDWTGELIVPGQPSATPIQYGPPSRWTVPWYYP